MSKEKNGLPWTMARSKYVPLADEGGGGFKSAGSYEGAKLFERCAACDGTGVEALLPTWKRNVEEIDRH
jgi:hypothetical protein